MIIRLVIVAMTVPCVYFERKVGSRALIDYAAIVGNYFKELADHIILNRRLKVLSQKI